MYPWSDRGEGGGGALRSGIKESSIRRVSIFMSPFVIFYFKHHSHSAFNSVTGDKCAETTENISYSMFYILQAFMF